MVIYHNSRTWIEPIWGFSSPILINQDVEMWLRHVFPVPLRNHHRSNILGSHFLGHPFWEPLFDLKSKPLQIWDYPVTGPMIVVPTFSWFKVHCSFSAPKFCWWHPMFKWRVYLPMPKCIGPQRMPKVDGTKLVGPRGAPGANPMFCPGHDPGHLASTCHPTAVPNLT